MKATEQSKSPVGSPIVIIDRTPTWHVDLLKTCIHRCVAPLPPKQKKIGGVLFLIWKIDENECLCMSSMDSALPSVKLYEQFSYSAGRFCRHSLSMWDCTGLMIILHGNSRVRQPCLGWEVGISRLTCGVHRRRCVGPGAVISMLPQRPDT